MSQLILSLCFLGFCCFVSFKFGEANERIKRGIRRRTGPVELNDLRAWSRRESERMRRFR